MPKLILTSFLIFGAMPAAPLTEDLSKYRDFQLGTGLAAVAKQVGVDPALIQELDWRPQPLGSSSRSESAQDVVFSFYDGELFRIAIEYDRHAAEGMTSSDFIEAISASYGPAEKPGAPGNITQATYGDQSEIPARWQESQYRPLERER